MLAARTRAQHFNLASRSGGQAKVEGGESLGEREEVDGCCDDYECKVCAQDDCMEEDCAEPRTELSREKTFRNGTFKLTLHRETNEGPGS